MERTGLQKKSSPWEEKAVRFFKKKERKKKDVREGLLELQFSSPVSVLLLLIECKSTFCGAKREEFSSDRVLAGHSMQPWLFWMPTPVWWVPGAFPCLFETHQSHCSLASIRVRFLVSFFQVHPRPPVDLTSYCNVR